MSLRDRVRSFFGRKLKPKLFLENRTGYDTRDLRRLMLAAMVGEGVPGPLHALFVTAPSSRTRACAEIGSGGKYGKKIVMAISSPSRWRWKRTVRVLRHELEHIKGKDHHEMAEAIEWSIGPVPAWSLPFEGWMPRYTKPAPSQFLPSAPRVMRGRSKLQGFKAVDAGYGRIFESTRK